jgi:ubiquinone/menaquinone biosynthesis C-methylase UbiE
VAALPGPQVVDLAAGTGKLTRALVARGLDVIAVEPVAEMRAAIRAPARVLEGTAEAIPLPDACADGVTVAQAFHWFDGERALAEIHRVLRPGGVLALIWNRRDMRDELQQRITAMLEPHRAGTPAHRDGAWRAVLDASPRFGALREQTSANAQVLDGDGLADRIGSISFVGALGEAERAELLDAIRALAGPGAVALRYVVELQLTTRL